MNTISKKLFYFLANLLRPECETDTDKYFWQLNNQIWKSPQKNQVYQSTDKKCIYIFVTKKSKKPNKLKVEGLTSTYSYDDTL